jgi:hypothetical protein
MSDDHFLVVALANGGLLGLSQLPAGQTVQPGAVRMKFISCIGFIRSTPALARAASAGAIIR